MPLNLEEILALPDIGQKINYLKKGRKTELPDRCKLWDDWNPERHEIMVDKTPYTTVKVSVCSYEAACKQLMKVWFIDVASKLGDAILVEYDAPNRQMGMDVVNAIMGEYNAKRLDRTHSRAAEEVAYYDEAIAKLMVEVW